MVGSWGDWIVGFVGTFGIGRMDVIDVLRDRTEEPDGLRRMAVLSAIAHGGLIAMVLLAPRGWLTRAVDTPATVMTITLGGSGAGPENGGMTAIGGVPVQAELPPEAPPKREPIRPPAAKTPVMAIPRAAAKPVTATPGPVITYAPDEARGRTPIRGAEVRPGSAVAETGVRGLGFGLSSGGGPGFGSKLDVEDFCCPEYVAVMIERIRGSWVQQAEVAGSVMIKFTIERDGRLTQIMLEKSSGYTALDIAAQRAVQVTRQLPALPAAFPNAILPVHLNFQYQR